MNTIKIYLSTSGRVADVKKDFPLYCGQFQDVLVKIFVPTEILSADFSIQHFIGNYSSNLAIGNVALQGELDDFVADSTYDPETGNGREPVSGDVVFYTYTEEDKYYRAVYNGSGWVFSSVPYFAMGDFAGTNVKLGVIATESNGAQYKSKSYYCRYVRTIIDSREGVQYAQYERKMPREFTAAIGSGQAARTVVINVVNTSQETKVTNIVTSQTINLDVLPSSQLDGDEPIDTTAQEELWSAINDIAEGLSEKQDVYDSDLSVPKNVAAEERTVVGAINDLESRKQNKVDTSIDYKSQTTVVGAINKLAQDKQESTDNSLLTESKTIVGAINEVDEHADAANAQAAENKEDISGLKTRMTSVEGVADAADTRSRDNTTEITGLKGRMTVVEGVADAANGRSLDNASDIADLKPRMTAVEGVADEANARSIQNASEIATLETIVGTGEDFIGTMTINYDPTQNPTTLANDLNSFVQTEAGRAPKGGDSVIVVEDIVGQTDRNFKYIYTGTEWHGYEIPPVELAGNGTAGIISGTYTVGATANTVVSIVSGEIQAIYVKDGSEYRDIRDFLLANKLSIANIIDGTTVVKEAEIATKDSSGNNIATSFSNIVSGTTKVGAAANADAAEVATKDSNGDNIATKFAGIIDGSTKVGAAAAADSAEVATKDSAGNNIANSFSALVSGATKVGAAANADAAETATKDSAGNNIATQFSNIVSGTTQVGSAAYAAEALKATQDALGNNIVNTYLTQLAGATKQYVKDYALPKEFNNVLYIDYSNTSNIVISESVPQSAGNLSTTFSSIGEHELFTAKYALGDVKFELSRKNSYSARMFFTGTGSATSVQFKAYVYAKKAGQSQVLLVADLLAEQEMPSTMTAVDFGAQFTALNNTVLELTTGDEIIVTVAAIVENSGSTTISLTSTETYPSRINLNTVAQIITYRLSEVGQAIFLDLSALTPTVDGSGDLYYETDNADLARVVDGAIDADITILLPNFGAITGISDTSRIYISVDGGTNYFTLSTAEHATAVVGDLALSQRADNKYIVWGTYHGGKIELDVPKVKSYVDGAVSGAKGVSGTATLLAASWSGTSYSLTIAGLGTNDAIFFSPATTTDKGKMEDAGIFISPVTSGTTVSITAETTPSTDIALDYFITRGTV